MKTLTVFLGIFLLLIISAYALDKAGYIIFFYFSVDRSDTVTINELKILEGGRDKATADEENSDYIVRVIGPDGRALSSFPFGITWEIYHMGKDTETGEIKSLKYVKNVSEHAIRLPYYTEAERIEVYHKDRKIFSKSVRLLTCRINNRCEGDEDIVNCPEDCRPRIFPSASILPTEVPQGDDLNKTGEDKILWPFLAAIALFFVLISLISMAKGKRKKRR
ncbi:MAG: hypothetical protein HYX24_00510 [Candidatus Aenigmarchaeota archaeon]|nr:hypothetical protein [Candidatus Aenigmarchaeota archaeon]